MKIVSKIKFGIDAVQAGQKSTAVNSFPTLTVNTTTGKFSLTPAVSKALCIVVGENVMFLNNINRVEQAVQERNEDIIAYAEENGIDLNTREGEDKVIEAFTQWFIAKGVPQYNSKGEPIMSRERFTKEDKAKYLENHALEIVEANREALIERFGNLTDEELASNLTVDMVESPKVQAVSGSKTSTTASTTGIGCSLYFTDTAIWNALKVNLGESATEINRVYDVLLSDAVKTDYYNGYKNVEITAYPIEFKEDVKSMRK